MRISQAGATVSAPPASTTVLAVTVGAPLSSRQGQGWMQFQGAGCPMQFMPCPEKCDHIETSGECPGLCANDFRIDHEICLCNQHRRVCPSVVHMRRFFARDMGRRRCISPGCLLTVGGPEYNEDRCCGCCKAQSNGYAAENWKPHGKWCSSTLAKRRRLTSAASQPQHSHECEEQGPGVFPLR